MAKREYHKVYGINPKTGMEEVYWFTGKRGERLDQANAKYEALKNKGYKPLHMEWKGSMLQDMMPFLGCERM